MSSSTDQFDPAIDREARRVAVAATVGTAIEFYDFILFATCAALVFGPQFFPSADATASQIGALATFAVAFVARPFGGVIAGHFGDRIGRKKVLLWSFVLMGAATALIGFLPNYASIGIAAPLLLVALRILQGLAAGAEWGGALLMAVEHAPENKRTLYASAPVAGTVIGSALASGVVLAALAYNPVAFMEWGWRIAFVVSIALVVMGAVVRHRLTESPLFLEALRKEPPRVPLLEVFRSHPLALSRGFGLLVVTGVWNYVGTTYLLSFGAATLGYSVPRMLLFSLAAAPVAVVTMTISARMSDRFSPRAVVAVVAVFQAVLVFAVFPLFESGSAPLILCAFVLALALNYAIFSPASRLLAELFPTNVRYSGVATAYNLAYLVGGLGPVAATAIYRETGTNTLVAACMCALALLAGFVAVTLPRSATRTPEDEVHLATRAAGPPGNDRSSS